MSKKSKRQVRRSSSRQRVATDSGTSSTPRKPAEQGFHPDYTYVIKDLKRIGTLAGTFFVILIALSFILRY
jgi:hypothetical protein